MAFHALVWLILIPAFIALGYWQRTLWKDRADSQGLVYAKLDAKPVSIDAVDPIGHDVSQPQQWISVTATGHYDTAHQFAVRNRSQNENAGWYVVTPLVLPNGTAVLVNQGWIATSNGDVPSTAMPALPPVPSGTVTVSGWLQPDETTGNTSIKDDTASLPAGEIALITKGDLQSRVPEALHDGSIQLNTSSPANTGAAAAQPIPGPSYDNTMYIAYMCQWWVFAIIMPVTWLKLLHREAQELKNKALVGHDDDWTEGVDEDDDEWDDEDEDWEEDADDEDWAEDEDDEDEEPSESEPASAPVPAVVGAAPAPASDRGEPVE
jgi:cytochrome oxidase assembly protein ShyY1